MYNKIINESELVFPEEKVPDRKIYIKPELAEMGDLRSLTLGASVGNTFDSDLTTLWTLP